MMDDIVSSLMKYVMSFDNLFLLLDKRHIM